MFLKTVVLLFASLTKIAASAYWCYESQVTCNHTCSGPAEWGEISHLCSGSSQSPVNIVTRRLLIGKPSAFQFTGYQDTFHGRLLNNGHTVALDLPSTIRIEGGNLPSTYKAIQLHLHWGKDGGPGSEHTIDGEQFPMEMHIVHIKEQYSSLPEASADPTGVAVLGFFFQESTSANKKYDPIVNALQNISLPSNSSALEGVSLEMLIPPRENLTRYFRYNGSLTTPNCAEAVVWTLFENTIPLSRKQLAAFSQLRFADEKQMVNTFRPPQPLNGRQIYYSGGNVASVSTLLLFASLLMSCFNTLSTKTSG